MTFSMHRTTREQDTGDYEWYPAPQEEKEKQTNVMVIAEMGKMVEVGILRAGAACGGNEFIVHGELGFT